MIPRKNMEMKQKKWDKLSIKIHKKMGQKWQPK